GKLLASIEGLKLPSPAKLANWEAVELDMFDELDLLALEPNAFAYELAKSEAAVCCCLLVGVPEAEAAAIDRLLRRLEAFRLAKLVEDEEADARLSLVRVRIELPALDDIDTYF